MEQIHKQSYTRNPSIIPILALKFQQMDHKTFSPNHSIICWFNYSAIFAELTFLINFFLNSLNFFQYK